MGDDDVAGTFQSVLDDHGFHAWTGLTVEEVSDGGVVLSISYDEKFANRFGDGPAPVHGGIVATLVDTASAFALRATFEDPMGPGITTVSLDVTYLRPATGDLVARAESVRAGGSIGVTDVTVESTPPSGEGKAVAVGRTVYRLFRE